MTNLSWLLEQILEGEQKWKFETKLGNILPHHITLNAGDKKIGPYAGAQEDLGKDVQIQVLGLAIDSTNFNVAAVNVEIPSDIVFIGKVPHITVAIFGNENDSDKDGKPMNAGQLNFSGQGYIPLNLTLNAILANIDTNGPEMRGYEEAINDPKKAKGAGQLVLKEASAILLRAEVERLLSTASPINSIIDTTSVIQEQVEGEEGMPKKKIFVLIGPPSVGKSRWIKDTFEEPPFVISRDDIVDEVAAEHGWTYDDLMTNPLPDAEIGDIDENFGEVIPAPKEYSWTKLVFADVLDANKEVQFRFNNRVADAPAMSDNIDMTNMNSSARKNNLRSFGNLQDYEKIAVVFEFQGIEDSILKVAEKRAAKEKLKGKSKTIPASVLTNMMSKFSRPTSAEGYDKIVSVDKRALLKKLANGEDVSEEDKVREKIYESSRFKHLAGIIKG
jgi:hypothetical protein